MVILLIASLAACVQTAPPELLEAVESLDRDLVAIRGVEFAPTEYARFVQDWAALRGRMLAEEDVITLQLTYYRSDVFQPFVP